MEIERLLKIKKLVTDNPVLMANRETSVDVIELMRFYNNLERILIKEIDYSEVGDKLLFAVIFGKKETDSKAGLNIFETKRFVSEILSGLFEKGNVLHVDCDGNIIKHDEIYISDPVEAGCLSKKTDEVLFFIQYRAVHLFVKGKYIDYIYDILTYRRKGVTCPDTLPAKEYRKLIERQYKEVVYKEKGIPYWRKKSERILVANPERHFHKPLWSYLKSHIVGAKVDSGATISGQEDRTDIRIITFDTDLYIIEIKCLGQTESDTNYSDSWANEGLIQLNKYLEEENDCTLGTLVIYDGRKEDKDIVWCKKIKCHPKYDGKHMRFYLESESASKESKKIYRKMRGKKDNN